MHPIAEKSKQIGQQIYKVILQHQKNNNISRDEIAIALNRSTGSANKLFFDLKNGKINLFNLLRISQALGLELHELLQEAYIIDKEDGTVLNAICDEIKKIKPGRQFELKEVAPHLWSKISYPERRMLGKEFYTLVEDHKVPNVIFRYKKSNNHALYEKK